MCGIVGFSGGFSRDLLERMTGALAHRGPDDEGVHFDEAARLGFGHRRLSIIDLSEAGHQPMWDSTGRAVITYNGEIYNYPELREELLRDGYVFNSHCDTEVLLNLYLREGRGMLERLNGIYAFAIFDSRTWEMLVARDGLGVKPLYYSSSERGFLFGSELKALLLDPALDRSIDEKAIVSYLTYLWSPGERTPLRSVKKLLPGQALIVKDGQIVDSWSFYDLPYSQPIADYSAEEAIERVERQLDQAVRRQLIADVPVGAFLSGGLDSSSIVALARKYNPDISCFTIGFRDDRFALEGVTADLPYAQRVAELLGVPLHTIEVGPEMVGQLERMIYHLDEPQADPAAINTMFICQLAREHGLKVLLSGTGGDDIFTGYRRHFALTQERYWSGLPVWMRGSLRRISQAIPGGSPSARRVRKAFRYAQLPADRRLISYFFWADPESVIELMNDSGPDRAALNPFEPLEASLARLDDNVPALNRMLYLEGKHFLADHNLSYTDKMSMSHGIEVRVPLLDPDLVALTARLPLSFKQNGSTGKWVFKKAMERHLPQDVIYRPKTGFGVPLRRWLADDLQELVGDLLSPASIEARGLFDPERVQAFIRLDREGTIDGSYPIFALTCIELWCRTFLG